MHDEPFNLLGVSPDDWAQSPESVQLALLSLLDIVQAQSGRLRELETLVREHDDQVVQGRGVTPIARRTGTVTAIGKAIESDQFKTTLVNIGQELAYLDGPDFQKFWDIDGKRTDEEGTNLHKALPRPAPRRRPAAALLSQPSVMGRGGSQSWPSRPM